MTHFLACLQGIFIVCWLTCEPLLASDWPQFRGPNGSGVSDASNLPVKFGVKENVLWKIAVPLGNSSPIVAGNRVFLTASEKETLQVLCLDAPTGKLLWQKGIVKNRVEHVTPPNDASTPSPVTDGKNVYVLFPETGLIAFGVDGQERWRVSLGPFKSVHGVTASPIVVDGNLFVLVDQLEDSYLAAFDTKDGVLRWRAERASGFLGGYSTPVAHRPGQGPVQVVVAGALELTGYSAMTGERLWWARGLTNAPVSTPVLNRTMLYICEPVADSPPSFDQMLSADKNKDSRLSPDEMGNPGMARLVTSLDRGYGNNDGVVEAGEWNKAFEAVKTSGGLVAVHLGGTGDVTRTGMRWRYMKSLPYVSSTLLYKDILYMVRDGGILTSLNPETGEVLKQGRLEGAIDPYYASPVGADDKIVVASQTGKVTVLKAGAEWDILSVNDLGEECYATPAIANNRIYVRTRGSLYCFAHSTVKR